MRPAPAVVFSEEQIRERVKAMGSEISSSLAGREVCVVGMMKSCLVFMADLIRAVRLDMTCHFVRASSLRDTGQNLARTEIVFSTEIPYEDQDILLLVAIIDTGITLNFLLDQIRERHPRSLKVCALIDKPGERKIDVHPEWAAFTLEGPQDLFLVGYGLDHDESYRGLPYIGSVPRPASQVEGRKTFSTGR